MGDPCNEVNLGLAEISRSLVKEFYYRLLPKDVRWIILRFLIGTLGRLSRQEPTYGGSILVTIRLFA